MQLWALRGGVESTATHFINVAVYETPRRSARRGVTTTGRPSECVPTVDGQQVACRTANVIKTTSYELPVKCHLNLAHTSVVHGPTEWSLCMSVRFLTINALRLGYSDTSAVYVNDLLTYLVIN